MANSCEDESQTRLPFCSRRSPVLSLRGCVASDQPIASQIGIDILKSGGNAADAAVAMSAALNVTLPSNTGIGGDCFCLFYNSKNKTVQGINGSGRAPSLLSPDLLKERGFTKENPVPNIHALNITVPGAAAGWADTMEQFGSKKLTLQQVLQPAIDLAENGFAVHEMSAAEWLHGSKVKGHTSLGCAEDDNIFNRSGNPHGGAMMINGRIPRHGDIMKMPMLAQTFKELACHGKEGFYQGRIAQAIVDIAQANGGVISLEDLRHHVSETVDPISVSYRGVRLWEIPPNGQGITALMALNVLEGIDLKGMGHNSSQYVHHLTEALRLSFSDSLAYCADSKKADIPIQELLSKKYAAKRRELIKPESSMATCSHGDPVEGGDTTYFTIVDTEGNACSFINSNYQRFGTGLVPEGCGFTLHNRGHGFSSDPNHPTNARAPNKRPYHTIIPAMLTDDRTGDLLASYGVMGAFFQPQGHVQVLLNMLEFGMNPQRALDAARIGITVTQDGCLDEINVEDGVPSHVLNDLRAMGHNVVGPFFGHDRCSKFHFGRGHVITRGNWWDNWDEEEESNGTPPSSDEVLWGGADPRSDGMAVPQT